MINGKPTHEELLEWYDISERNYKAMEVLKSLCVWAGMMIMFAIIETLAKIGATTAFEVWKLTPYSIQICNAFLQIGISLVYVYMVLHFVIVVLFTYHDDINKFDGKWKAFKAWYKKEKETATEDKP